jgi:hypothetical protein
MMPLSAKAWGLPLQVLIENRTSLSLEMMSACHLLRVTRHGRLALAYQEATAAGGCARLQRAVAAVGNAFPVEVAHSGQLITNGGILPEILASFRRREQHQESG